LFQEFLERAEACRMSRGSHCPQGYSNHRHFNE
jgi:hypothetical protein